MKCEEARDQLVAYARGELEGSEKSRVEEHLVRCQGCTRELEGARQVMAVTQMADDESIGDLANQIVTAALERRASDIHLETFDSGPVVRVRVDGVLHRLDKDLTPTKEQWEGLVARFKLMAGCSLSERRMPQDGRMLMSVGERTYDLRMSFVPTIHGESLVARILDKQSVLLGLDRLGLSQENLAKVRELMRQPRGMIVVTGPTGSGKTTLLYSILMELNRPEVKILTVEDPVEYAIEGINQVAVNAQSGLTFASALRAFLRHDPDIIMVGEIRDQATAAVANQAALTGHLVLATLHTQDAPGAFTRLIDIGLPGFVVSAGALGAIAQRLVRCICPGCKTEYHPDEAERTNVGVPGQDKGSVLYRGAGCEQCRGTGYRGRIAIHEVLVLTPEIHKLISANAPSEGIRQAAIAAGMKTMREDAMEKVRAGVTTMEEAEWVLMGR